MHAAGSCRRDTLALLHGVAALCFGDRPTCSAVPQCCALGPPLLFGTALALCPPRFLMGHAAQLLCDTTASLTG
jgi:hypothetical protein